MTVTSELVLSKQFHLDVSLIIQVYKEEKKVLALLMKAKEIASGLTASSYEILVVNDGSDDNTLNVLLEAKKRIPTFVLSHIILIKAKDMP